MRITPKNSHRDLSRTLRWQVGILLICLVSLMFLFHHPTLAQETAFVEHWEEMLAAANWNESGIALWDDNFCRKKIFTGNRHLA